MLTSSSTADSAKSPSRFAHSIALISLLIAGFVLWRLFDRDSWYTAQQFWNLGLQAAIVSVPPINQWISAILARLSAPTPRSRAITSIVIACVATLYLYASALQQHRDFFPKYHDEYMHLVQAQLLAHGKLWGAPHALPQFFETFHVFVTPVYAGQHFPGTAMVYVPGIWLHLPWWMTSLLVAGAGVGLIYRVIAELIDGVAGWLAAFMLLGTLEWRYVSLMALSNPIALVLGLLMIWAWLRWRAAHRRLWWALALGYFSGFAAITRPQDALCFAIPIGAAILLDSIPLSRQARDGRWFAAPLSVAGAVVAGAVPFMILQLAFDRGVTGHWLKTPHQYYGDLFYPGVTYGLHPPRLDLVPATQLPQKLDYYRGFIREHMQAYTLDTAWRAWIDRRFPVLFKASLPSNLLLFLLPAGIVGLTSHGRWVALVVFPLFVAFYALNIMFGSVYAVLLVVTMLPLAIMGARRIERGIEGAIPILARRTRPVLTMLLLGISLASLPQFNPATEQYAAPTLQAVEHSLHSIEGRALVFFRYRTGQNVHEEPVYNIEGAEIDAQRIVRAHDLGSSENLKLIRYYADRQPDRRAYLFDRGSRTLTLLGPVTQLAAQSAAPQPEVPIPSAR